MPKMRAVLVAVLSVVAVAGCTGDPPTKTLNASSFVGQTLGQVYTAIGYKLPSQPPPDLGVVTVNMTGLVTTGVVPADQPQPDWTVVASCWTDAPAPNGSTDRLPRIMLGTVPTKFANAEVVEKARQGAYKGQIAECGSQTPDTFSVTAS